jgi:high affinity sulfate transporter 1
VARERTTRREHIGALERVAPGLARLLRYDFSADFRSDLVAGLSVAAVALPVAIAYAQLAGFDPVVGLYSSILPLVAYAIFGTSRQLMVNPDAATCAMVAASVGPLAAGNPELYWSLSVALAFFAGVFCLVASLLRLGALADFLSKPILVGYLNGIAISILLGQIGKVFGFSIESGRIVPRLVEFVSKLPQTHVPTLAIGATAFAVQLLSRRYAPRLPAALLAVTVAGIAVASLELGQRGVAILGAVPAGLPPLRIPSFPAEHLETLIAHAAGLALVLFSSGMLTARSFADKNRYDIDTDRELAAFGAANIASALSQGFAVTGGDSRTAVADSAGGRSQVTGFVAASAIASVLLFFTEPLSYVPIAALGAVLCMAAVSLFDVVTLREMWILDKRSVALSGLTTLGVVAVGAIHAILVAVGLALLRFIRATARPRDEILGKVEGFPGFHSIDRHPDAQTWPGILIYRFDAPIVFFNATYFKQRALRAVDRAGPELRWFVLDMIPISGLDVTGAYALRELKQELELRGIRFIYAGRKTEFVQWLHATGIYRTEIEERMFPTMRAAIKSYRREALPSAAPPEED